MADRHEKSVLLEQFVQGSGLAHIPFAGARPLRTAQRRRVAQDRRESSLRNLDVAAQRDPHQRLTSLLEDVVSQTPLVIPRLRGQWSTLARQIVERAALLGFAYLFLDSTLPLRELPWWIQTASA